MPITVRQHWHEDGPPVLEVIDATPDRYLLEWPGLVPFGPLWLVDWECRRAVPDLAVLGLDLVEVDVCLERAASWYADRRTPEWRWIRAAFRARDAYWWVLREVLCRRLHVIVPGNGEMFSWRRHFRPFEPLRLAWLYGRAAVLNRLLMRWATHGGAIRIKVAVTTHGRAVSWLEPYRWPWERT